MMNSQTKSQEMDSTRPIATTSEKNSTNIYSDDEDEPTVETSEYSQEPDYDKSPFWNKENLQKHIDKINKFHQNDSKVLCTSSEEITKLKNRFKNKAIQNKNYSKFEYKKPIRVLCVTNIYGLLINNVDNWKNNRAVTDVAYLSNKNRVSILCGSASHWWHKTSKDIITILVNRVFEDIKCLMANAHFRDGIETFELEDNLRARVMQAKERILTASVSGTSGSKPGVLNIKLYNTPANHSKIDAQLGAVKETRAKQGQWNQLIPPSYFHAALVIRLDGFKITKSGFTLDMFLENLACEKVACREKVVKSITKKCFSDDDSDDDDEPIPTKRYKKITADW